MSDYISEEVMVKILKLLSVESLLRLRCVCRRWKQLIDSPSLVVDHLTLQKPRFIGLNAFYASRELLVVDPYTQTQNLPLLHTLQIPFEPRVSGFIFGGTLHGIVYLYELVVARYIFLWNPSMHKVLNVHLPDMHYYRDKNLPSHHMSWTYSTFWINPLTKDFKIIVVNEGYTRHRQQREKYGAIYSSIGSNWKEICPSEIEKIDNLSFCKQYPAVIIGKMAYWRSFQGTGREVKFNRMMVTCFDFEQECVDIIEGPITSLSIEGSFVCGHSTLHSWHGFLSFVHLDTETRCDIYIREKGSWVNMFRFNIMYGIRRVLCILEKRDKFVGEEMQEHCSILATTPKDEMILNDKKAGGYIILRSRLDDPIYSAYMAHGFVESLVFP